MRLPPALRYRDYRLFTIGYLPSETGEYIHFVVQNWLVWELTESAFFLGLIGFCEFAPRFIFGPIGGVIADRMNRQWLVTLSCLLNLFQSLAFAALIFSGLLQVWHIVGLVIFMAIVSSIRTAAQQVMVVSLVPQDSVVSALALHSATHNLTKVVGPSVGGVLLTLVGAGYCLIIHAATQVFMLAALFMMRASSRSTAATTNNHWFKDIIEGVSYFRENQRIWSTILTTYSNGFFGISYAQFLPYFAQEVLHVGPGGYGLLVSAPGVGAVLVSFFLSTHNRLRRMRRLLSSASLIYAAAIFFFALSRFMVISLLLLAVIGAMQMSYRVLARAIIQEECPDHLLGRAMSLFFIDRGFGSLGAVCLGTLAAVVPVPMTVAASAIGCGLFAGLVPKSSSKQQLTLN